jgi:ubiquinone/menaquinone biosynthesis C-methylase UbiE
MSAVVDALLASVDVHPGVHAVDLGCGTGRIALPLAQAGASVLAVDVSEAMIDALDDRVRVRGLPFVRGLALPLEQLDLSPASCDLVVSSYALHHLRDADKERLVAGAFRWLRPGGQLVIADMMFGRGTTPEDRRIIAAKVKALAFKGVPGYWRIAKNAARFLARVHEQPLTRDAWERLLTAAGFADVFSRPIAAEANLVGGRKPGPGR